MDISELRSELGKPQYASAIEAEDWEAVRDLCVGADIRIPRTDVPGWRVLKDFMVERIKVAGLPRLIDPNDPSYESVMLIVDEFACMERTYSIPGAVATTADLELMCDQAEGTGIMVDLPNLPISEQRKRVLTVQFIPTVGEITAAVFNDDGTRAI